MKRAGFTLIEVLIAAALGAVVLGLAVDQVTAYFRVQRTLMTRVSLRNELEVAETRLEQELRTCVHVVPDGDGYITIIVLDANGDGAYGPGDRVKLGWWKLRKSPLTGESDLMVQHATAPAFDIKSPPETIEPFFDGSTAHLVARHVTRFWIDGENFNLARLHLEAQQDVPRRPPIVVDLNERVARRTLPELLPLPMPSVPTPAPDSDFDSPSLPLPSAPASKGPRLVGGGL
ncbi:MAG TPA: prepilin-type N-terminal cleavage/methylation domain-containing protein [Oscillatoriaceae cyanobacterium]